MIKELEFLNRARICKPFKEPGIDSQPGGPVRQPYVLVVQARHVTQAGGIDSSETIPGIHKRLKTWAQGAEGGEGGGG